LSGGDLIRQPDGQQGLPQGSDIPVNQIPDLGMSDGTLKTATNGQNAAGGKPPGRCPGRLATYRASRRQAPHGA
jgi:hypothetical protein